MPPKNVAATGIWMGAASSVLVLLPMGCCDLLSIPMALGAIGCGVNALAKRENLGWIAIALGCLTFVILVTDENPPFPLTLPSPHRGRGSG